MKHRLDKIVCDIEAEGRANLQVQLGCLELLAALRQREIPCAIITSNNMAGVHDFLQLCARHSEEEFRFQPIVTRDDGAHLRKPLPAGVQQICETWKVSPHQVLMVGDHLNDLIAGREAGCATCLILCDDPCNHHFQESADITVRSLDELDNLEKYSIQRSWDWMDSRSSSN